MQRSKGFTVQKCIGGHKRIYFEQPGTVTYSVNYSSDVSGSHFKFQS